MRMEDSGQLPTAVQVLYREIVGGRLGGGATPSVDPALVADLAVELTVGGVLRGLSHCTDLASTGGPGSISTMLVPLMMRAGGIPVAKVGVPGRPAGAVDVLATVPNYRWSSTEDEFDAAMRGCGFAHTAANEYWAPGDAVLFRVRQTEGTQRLPALVVASLLAKKLAAGVKYPGFEVRAAQHGNFGSSPGEVRSNASFLCEVADRLGMRATVFVTNADYPHQPWVGRGEALTALAAVSASKADGGASREPCKPVDPEIGEWVAGHVRLCEDMARTLTAACVDGEGESIKAGNPPGTLNASCGEVRNVSEALTTHLIAHGASHDELERRAAAVTAASREVIPAQSAGFVRYRMERIRDHLVRANNSGTKQPTSGPPTFRDNAGAILHVPPGARVVRGDPVLSLRWPTGERRPEGCDLFEITDECPVPNASEQLQEIIG